jgi:polyisoprenoid-binding protein YceI
MQQAAAGTARATETWQIDSAHASAAFAVKHLMVSTVRGRFSDVKGTVMVAGEDPLTAKADVTIGVGTVDTGIEQRDNHLRSADFFHAEQFPTMTFRSTKVEQAGQDAYRVTGDLTIRGTTRPITLSVTSEGRTRDPWGNDRMGFSASGRLSRKDFGLVWNQLMETGGAVVGDEVKLTIDVEITKPVSAAVAA